jgi:hypothetical protein
MKYAKSTVTFLTTFPALIFLVGIIGVVFLPCIKGGALAGDIGDARFNQYVLEHFYRVISGKEASMVFDMICIELLGRLFC